ncbi:MAG: protease inhibitor Inh/omp19 family protein [Microvirga sp.]|nr:protease inhibitor Inh/omp19 family protein [Microvirga sp.]
MIDRTVIARSPSDDGALRRTAWRAGAALALAGALVGCQSARMGQPPIAPRAEVVQPLSPGLAAPAGVVMAEPLAPPAGSSDLGDLPRMSAGVVDLPGTSGQRQAALSQPSPAPARAVSRTNIVGTWRASEPGGGSCSVTLSSTPVLDLYRASASQCSNAEMSRINSWDLRGEEVYLYQQGGAVAARLQARSGSMQGVISRSGAPLSMAR